jgi:nucleotide-binding universal stress UspA family protein
MTKIVVGVDASESSARALAWAADEARLRGVTLEAVYVWELPVFVASPFGAMPIDTRAAEESAQAEFYALVDGVDASKLPAPVERTFAAGSPAAQLLEAAADAELLVVGSRGHGGFAGLLLGSVSQQVSQHSRCPVVIVPAER